MIIGIDLGTTNSAAGYMSDDGPRLLPNALGEVLTPSVVGVDDSGEILVGKPAKEFAVLAPDRCAALFKRQMGSNWTTTLVGRKFNPVELSSLVLRSLKADAEAQLGMPVTRAVISVPAYFNDRQRKATIEAGQLAGLAVERIVNEPTAAAIAYGLHETGEEKIVVVFDLGGGTFDVSVVELFEGMIEVRASSGENFLGGEDFTRVMAARILEARGHVFEHAELSAPAMVSRTLQQCERAKQELSRRDTARVMVADVQGKLDGGTAASISRAEFQQWTEHILARVELPIRRGLGDAGLNRTDVDEIILVGGATRMPAVIQRVTAIFGKQPQCRFNPDEVVALGAAVQAGLIAKQAGLDDLVVTDVAPFTLGIEITKRVGLELRDGYFLPVINRNTTIPVSRVERVQTLQANQTEVYVKVYQGESRKVKDNLQLGELTVKDVPRGPAGQDVDVRFTYDLNGVLEVEATIVQTQKKAGIVITKHARALSQREIQRAIEEMQSLKTHPREESENRFLVKRAERLYQELPLLDRQMLAELLDGFEAAMELQEEEAIDRHRKELASFLNYAERGFDGPEDDYEEPYE